MQFAFPVTEETLDNAVLDRIALAPYLNDVKGFARQLAEQVALSLFNRMTAQIAFDLWQSMMVKGMGNIVPFGELALSDLYTDMGGFQRSTLDSQRFFMTWIQEAAMSQEFYDQLVLRTTHRWFRQIQGEVDPAGMQAMRAAFARNDFKNESYKTFFTMMQVIAVEIYYIEGLAD